MSPMKKKKIERSTPRGGNLSCRRKSWEYIVDITKKSASGEQVEV